MRRFGGPAHIQLICLFTRAQRRKLFPCLMHTTDYSPPSARRAARPAAADDQKPTITRSSRTERLGVHGFHPDVLPLVHPGGDH
ncbi:hypothetical protein [Streptomyces mirabilis]|uniref:hypothetical protein n=1 Tax=Streptomyces mirabilis TaxID=68239 RepID=UPI00325250C2